MENNGSQATGKEVEANRLQGQEENRRLLDQYRGRKNKKQFMGCRIYSNLETGDIIIFRHDGKLLVKRIAAMANAFMVSGLTKTYQDFVLDHVLFTVPSGSIVGLIGENGAGKSTTINAALGLIQDENNGVQAIVHPVIYSCNRSLTKRGFYCFG